jgi:hypothetical protein
MICKQLIGKGVQGSGSNFFKVPSKHLCEETEKNHEPPNSRFQDKIWMRNLPDTKYMWQPFDGDSWA